MSLDSVKMSPTVPLLITEPTLSLSEVWELSLLSIQLTMDITMDYD